MNKAAQFIEFAGAVACMVAVGKLAGIVCLLLCAGAWCLGGMFVVASTPRVHRLTRKQVEGRRMQDIARDYRDNVLRGPHDLKGKVFEDEYKAIYLDDKEAYKDGTNN